MASRLSSYPLQPAMGRGCRLEPLAQEVRLECLLPRYYIQWSSRCIPLPRQSCWKPHLPVRSVVRVASFSACKQPSGLVPGHSVTPFTVLLWKVQFSKHLWAKHHQKSTLTAHSSPGVFHSSFFFFSKGHLYWSKFTGTWTKWNTHWTSTQIQ